VARIELWNGDICELEVDAIVNAANTSLWMSTGVGGAIKRAGGDAIEFAAVRQAPVELGSAIVTSAGTLAARYVIHAISLDRDRRTSGASIEAAVRSTFARARELGVVSLAFPALGTGVGGAVLANGRLIRGAIGRAGHLGHISLDVHGPVSILRTPGAIEELIGECSLAARTGGRFDTTRALLAAAETGDAAAAAVWTRSIRALACAIVSYINVLDPEVVILGGGITEAGDRLWQPLEREMDQIEWRPAGHRVPIVRAELGGWAGAYGAAAPGLG